LSGVNPEDLHPEDLSQDLLTQKTYNIWKWISRGNLEGFRGIKGISMD